MDEKIEQAENSVYIVNQKYEIVHFNRVLKENFPLLKCGDICYQALCQEELPCSNCPLSAQKNDNEIFYNKVTQCFVEVSSAPIDWPGESECSVILSKRLHEDNKRLLYKRNQDSALDPLTGLYRRAVFFVKAVEFLQMNSDNKYCLMAIDIEHFKLFNEWYGQEAGDRFLISIGNHLKSVQEASRGLAGYMGGDDFVIILPKRLELMERLQSQIMGYVKQYGGNAGFLPAFGIYDIADDLISVSTMYDRASIALSSVKGNYAKRVCWYDAEMTQRMEENHVLLSEVQRALKNGEFVFYAQPKCNMTTGKIIGLESLVRWIHPTRGLISPAEFIPVLENNGFITNLDLYIWEKVCKSVRNWIDAGYKAVPISVNMSQVDIYTLDVAEVFTGLIRKYHLEPRLIEIEITESAYAEEYHIISNVVERLRSAGFTVLMDDFGSGYSSLNMLKDVNVDVLKLDMKFLEMSEQSAGRGVGILEAIASMARLIGLRLIAEGVENKEQVDFLLNMGCIYGQGYYFYRPMPIEVFEPLLCDDNNVDYRGINAAQLERIHIKELLNEDVFSETVLNNILGGIAFYNVHDGTVELLRVNEHYYRITGTNPIDLEEQRKKILEGIHEEDHEMAMDIFSRAYRDPLNGAEGDIRRLNGDGSIMWMHLHAYFLREQDGSRLYYGAVSDATDQKSREQELLISGRKMESILRQAGINSWDWDMKKNTLTMLQVSSQDGLAKSFEILKSGQAVIEDFPRIIQKNSYIAKRHWKLFAAFEEQVFRGETTRCELPVTDRDGRVFWMMVASETIRDSFGTPIRAVGYYIDITEQKQEMKKSRENMKSLELLKKQALYEFKICLSENTITIGDKEKDSWFKETKCSPLDSYEEVISQVAKELVLPDYQDIFSHFMDRQRMLKLFSEGKQMECLEYQRMYKQMPKWMKMTVHLVQYEDSPEIYAYVFVNDIDAQKRQEMELTKMAQRDALTGLYNRQTAIPKIKSYLKDISGRTAALIMFDLDNFKMANDIFGHAYGDRVIAQNAQKLKKFFRGEDIVCRIGGDEFMILCKDISEENISRKLSDIMASMNTVCQVNSQSMLFSVSAGYAMIPSQGQEFEDLYQKADIALFSAKMREKGSFQKYDPSMKAIRYELADKE